MTCFLVQQYQTIETTKTRYTQLNSKEQQALKADFYKLGTAKTKEITMHHVHPFKLYLLVLDNKQKN